MKALSFLPNLRSLATRVIVLLAMAGMVETAAAANLVVSNITDSATGSLRDCLAQVPPGGIITFATNLSGQVILLNSTLQLNNDVTIDASMLANGIQINGQAQNLIMAVHGNIAVLNALTLTNGHGGGSGGGIYNDGTLTLTNCSLVNNSGGGIYNYAGTVTVNNSTLSNNSNSPYGGGICNIGGAVTVNNSSLVNNNSTYGGGIYNNHNLEVNNSVLAKNSGTYGGGIYLNGGTANFNNSTFTNNSSSGSGGCIDIFNGEVNFNNSILVNNSSIGGGGIHNSKGTLTVNNSTLANNSSYYGGGIFNEHGTATLNNVTLANNSGSYGGGIENGGSAAGAPLTINNCTIVNNSCIASSSGAIDNYNAVVNLNNTIVCSNTANGNPGNIFNFNNSGTINLGLTNLVGVDPLLAPLGYYGGPTPTMPPLPGSPAVNAGSDAAASALATDQRGLPRISGDHVDIGAVEFQFITAGNPARITSMAWTGSAGKSPFRFSFSNEPGASFRVYASTDAAQPLSAWTLLGFVTESPANSGQFQFTDPQATNNPRRFYCLGPP